MNEFQKILLGAGVDPYKKEREAQQPRQEESKGLLAGLGNMQEKFAGYEASDADKSAGEQVIQKWMDESKDSYVNQAALNAATGAMNVAAGISSAFGNDTLSDAVEKYQQMQPRRPEFDYTGSEYWTSPQGAWADLWQGLGSSVPMLGAGALVPEAAAVRGAGLLGRGLGRVGLGRVASSNAGSEILKDIVRGVPGAFIDSGSEYGSVAHDLRQQGDDNAAINALPVLGANLALNLFTTPVEYALMKGAGSRIFSPKAGEGVVKRSGMAVPRAMPGIAASAAIEGPQELLQETISGIAKGEQVGNPLNPYSWTPEQLQSFVAGAVGGAGMAAPGNIIGGLRSPGEIIEESIRGNASAADSGNVNTGLKTPEEIIRDSMPTQQIQEDETGTSQDVSSSASAQPTMQTNGNEYQAAIVQAAQQYNIPTNIALGIAARETGGDDVNAINMSENGGLMQITEESARDYGINEKYPNWRTDPKQNALAGMDILSQKIKENNGDVWAGVRAYNGAGPQADAYLEQVRQNAQNLGGVYAGNTEFSTYNLPTQGADIDEQITRLTPELRAALPAIGGILNDMGLAQGSAISSAARSAEHNAEVGGAEGSYHIDSGNGGNAVDIVLPEGTSQEQAEAVAERFRQTGAFEEVLFHDAGSGYHLHLGGYKGGLNGRAMNTETNTVPSFQDDLQKFEDAEIPDFASSMKDTTTNAEEYDLFDNMFTADRKGRDKFVDTPKNRRMIRERYQEALEEAALRRMANDVLERSANRLDTASAANLSNAVKTGDTGAIRTILSNMYDVNNRNLMQAEARQGREMPAEQMSQRIQTYLDNTALEDIGEERYNSLYNALRSGDDTAIREAYQNIQSRQGGVDNAGTGTSIHTARPAEDIQNQNGPAVPQGGEGAAEQGQAIAGQGSQAADILSRNRQVISQRPTGTAETMRADDPNVQFTGQYRLVSADDLTTSDGVGYPQQYQPRNRNRAVMRAQVANMANNLNPSAVVDATGNVNLGAPVIDESGVVLNGNGRTMAIRQAYQRNGQSAQAYKQYLKAHADAFGMTPDMIDSIENPVLVRQVGGDAPITDIIHSTAGGADMSAGEQAKSDAEKIKKTTLDLYNEESQSLTSAGNREFVKAVLRDISTGRDANRMYTENGQFSSDAIRRVQNAIFSKAYSDNHLLNQLSESNDNNIRNIINAMLKAAPTVAKINHGIQQKEYYSYPISQVVSDAAKTITSLRDQGKEVSFYLNETSLFGESFRNPSSVKDVMAFFDQNKRNSRKIYEFIDRLCERVIGQGNPRQQSLLPAPRPKLNEIMNQTIGEMNDGLRSLFESGRTHEAAEAGENVGRMADGVLQGTPGNTGAVQEAGRRNGEEEARSAEQVTAAQEAAPSEPITNRPTIKESEVEVSDDKAGDIEALRQALARKGEAVFNIEDYEKARQEQGDGYTVSDYAKDWMKQKFPNVARDNEAYREIERLVAEQMQAAVEQESQGAASTRAALDRVLNEDKAPMSVVEAYKAHVEAVLNDVERGRMSAQEAQTEIRDSFRAVRKSSSWDTIQGMDFMYTQVLTASEKAHKELQGKIASQSEETKKAANDGDVQNNIQRGKNAIKEILATHHDVPAAMYRPETGDIGFVYGDEGTGAKKHKDGYGIAKILLKHGKEAVDMIPEVVARGKFEESKYGDRAYFIHDNYRAVVRFTWDGKEKTWLVTNFIDEKIKNSRDADAFVRSAPTADGTISPSEGSISTSNVAQTQGEVNETTASHEGNAQDVNDIRDSFALRVLYATDSSERGKKYGLKWRNKKANNLLQKYDLNPYEADGKYYVKLTSKNTSTAELPDIEVPKAEYDYVMNLTGKHEGGNSNAITDSTGAVASRLGERTNQNELGETAGSGRPGRSDGQGVSSSDERRTQPVGDVGVSGRGPAAGGTAGDSRVQTQESNDNARSTGSPKLSGGVRAGLEGVPADEQRRPADIVKSAADGRADEANRIIEEQQKKAKDAKRIAEIRKEVPVLLPEQADDVLFAEKRLFDNDKNGVLFTNGTGTGKTFSGMGIVKRMYDRGKKNILIVAPGDGIIQQWVDAGKDHFNVPITPLKSTKDAGKGVCITTYSNLGQNHALASRDWDLLIMDESHTLSKNEQGNSTSALRQFWGLTVHDNGYQTWFEDTHQDITNARKEARKELDKAQKEKDAAKEKDAQQRYDEADRVYQKAYEASEPDYQGKKHPKVVFLSATPFAYIKNLQYAEGFLFEYPKNRNGQKDADQFLMDNFGYQYKNGHLERPGVEVDGSLMGKQFHDQLVQEGALHGRTLEVDADYDRGFIRVNNGIGNKIDEGFTYLAQNSNKYSELNQFIQKEFDYIHKRQLLEAIKAKEAVELVKQYVKSGKKVVVFHDYNEGGGMNPFNLTEEYVREKLSGKKNIWLANRIVRQLEEFKKERPDLLELDLNELKSPIETFQNAFNAEEVGFYNGQNKKTRIAEKDDFNDDNGKKKILVVQSNAGEAGISLHDTTGTYQRVLINLGMPTRPTATIQIEGRIYRVGNKSNAVFRYLNTGTVMEGEMFSKMAERSGMVEAIAMGEKARALQASINAAYEESQDGDGWKKYLPGSPTEGTGGKAMDYVDDQLSTYDKAKAFYFANQKKTSSNKSAEGEDYYATPEPLGLKMVEWADPKSGESMMEPSAGHGAIARWMPDYTRNTVVEPSRELQPKLQRNVSNANVVGDVFESLDLHNKFGSIVMNPPFGTGGKTAIEHLAKAFRHLNDGGRIVAIIPNGQATQKRFDSWFYGDENGKTKAERDGVTNGVLRATINLPAVTFERAGTKVGTKIVIIDRYDSRTMREAAAADVEELTIDAKSINELFDQIEELDMPPRIAADERQYSIAQKTDEELRRSVDELKAEIKEAFPGAKNVEEGLNSLRFEMQNGAKITVDMRNQIVATQEELDRAKQEHGYNANDNVVVEGFAETHGKEAYIALSQGSRKGTGFHEAFHVARSMALTDKEKAVLDKYYKGDEEKQANAYAEWIEARRNGHGTLFGKLWHKVQDMAKKIQSLFTGVENVHNVFRKMESGEIWSRDVSTKIKWKKPPEKHHADEGLLDTSETALRKSSSTTPNVALGDKSVNEMDSVIKKDSLPTNTSKDVHQFGKLSSDSLSVAEPLQTVKVKYSVPDEMSATAQLKEDVAKFSRAVDDFIVGKLPKKGDITVMTTPMVMHLAGAKVLPIHIDYSIMDKIIGATHVHAHGKEIPPSLLKKLPSALTDPLMIIKADRPDKMIVVVDLKDKNGATVIVPMVLDVNNRKNTMSINKIMSVYGKGTPIPNNGWIAKHINNNDLLYINKKRTARWMSNSSVAPNGQLASDSFNLSSIIPDETDLGKLKKDNPTKYSIRKANELQDTIKKQDQKIADDARKKFESRIEVAEKAKNPDSIGYLRIWLQSPSRIAEKKANFRPFFKMADRAMNTLTRLRADYARHLEAALKIDKKDKKTLSDLLWQGDAEGVEYSRDELKEAGYNDAVIDSYWRIRNLMRKAYRMLNDARRQAKTKSGRFAGKKLDDLRNNKFVEILKEEEQKDGSTLVTYKEYGNWTSEYNVSESELQALEGDDAIQILDKVPTERGQGLGKRYIVKVREGTPDINNRKGYIPHFFHEYLIRYVDSKGKSMVVGSGRNIKEATEKAIQYQKANPDKFSDTYKNKLFIAPKVFDFTQLGLDESQYGAIVGDKEYYRVVRKIADKQEMSLNEARNLLNGSVKKKGRHRFFGNFLQRKGAEGYEKDLEWVLRHYFNSASRYVAMETEFKPKAISLFERLYGRYDNEYSGLPHYIKEYIADINGNPSTLEKFFNEHITALPFFGKWLNVRYGDRPTIRLANFFTNKMSIAKLGFFNVSSAMLNILQLANTAAYTGNVSTLWKALGKGAHSKYSMKDLRVLRDTNVLNDIGLDSGAGYGKFSAGKWANRSMILFKTSEGIVRRGTVLAAFDAAKARGMSYDEAIKYAKEVNRKANFEYGVQDAPNIFRRGSIFSQLMLQFKKYPIKQLEVMKDMTPFLGKTTSKKQKAVFWGTYFAMAGLFQMPFANLIGLAVLAFTEDDPEKEAKKYIMQFANEHPDLKWLCRIALYGIGSAVDVDVSSRVGLGDAVPDRVASLAGPTASTVWNVAKGLYAGDAWERNVRSFSPGLGNLILAAEGRSIGKRGRTNAEYTSTYQRLLRGMGFNSTEESDAWLIQFILSNERNKKQSKEQELIDEFLANETAENAAKLKEAGISKKRVQEERKKKKLDARKRMESGLSKKEQKEYQYLINW